MSALQYYEETKKLIQRVKEEQFEQIRRVAEIFAATIIDDGLIHATGSGHSHMIAEELFVRAGGIANVNAWLDLSLIPTAGARKTGKLERLEGLAEIVWEEQKVAEDDVILIISNSGRNSYPVETALLAREKEIFSIGITSMEHTRQTESRHSSGKKLHELVDIVIDNCVPYGDGVLNFSGVKSGPASTLMGVFVVNCFVTETLKILEEGNYELPVYGSQNVDGVTNEDLFKKFQDRITHL